MPSYSNIFQPETSFALEFVDLENEDKKICPKLTLRLNLSNPISFCLLFYTFIFLIFNDLQANVRIRDFFTLIMYLAPEEEFGLLSPRKDIETPNKHTKRME